MKRLGLLVGFLSGLLSGCAGLPDLQLAKQAKASGDLATAESNFRRLAEFGYVDAEVGLADILVRSPSAERQAQGEAIYRNALGRSPEVPVRLGKWLAIKPQASAEEHAEAERLLRQGLAAGERTALIPLVSVQLLDPQKVASGEIDRELSQWQASGHAEAGLGKILLYRARGDYAEHLDEIRQTCEAWLAEFADCYVELASVYRQAETDEPLKGLLARLQGEYRAGQVPPTRLNSVADALIADGPGQPRPEMARELYSASAAQDPDAWADLADLLRRYPQLGSSEEMLAYLEQGVAAGSSRSAMMLGHLYLNGQYIPAEPAKAEKYLLLAAPEQPKAHIMLGRLYREGQLGAIDPEKALEHLLIAARAGNPSADLALAQLFGEGRGIRINPVYAYGFALLAQQEGLPQAEQWLQRMAPRLQPGDVERARAMASKESTARAGEQVSLKSTQNRTQGML